jgi:hypothetical protein
MSIIVFIDLLVSSCSFMSLIIVFEDFKTAMILFPSPKEQDADIFSLSKTLL